MPFRMYQTNICSRRVKMTWFLFCVIFLFSSVRFRLITPRGRWSNFFFSHMRLGIPSVLRTRNRFSWPRLRTTCVCCLPFGVRPRFNSFRKKNSYTLYDCTRASQSEFVNPFRVRAKLIRTRVPINHTLHEYIYIYICVFIYVAILLLWFRFAACMTVCRVFVIVSYTRLPSRDTILRVPALQRPKY